MPENDSDRGKMIGLLARFYHQAETSSFVREPSDGIEIDVSDLFAGDMFEEVSLRSHRDVSVFELEWKGSGKALADIRQDFFKCYGQIAEQTQFINETVLRDSIVFDIILGHLTPALAPSPYGYFLQFRLVGDRVREVIASYRELVKESKRARR